MPLNADHKAADQHQADLAALDAQIAARDAKLAAKTAAMKPKKESTAFGAAMRISADLLGSMFVGLAIAFGLAWIWPDLKALFVVLGFVLGFGVGFYNVWRATNAQFKGSEKNFNVTVIADEEKNTSDQSQ